MIAPVRFLLAGLLTLFPIAASAQCAPAPDSPYFFRNLSEQRAEARIAGNRAAYEQLLSTAFTAQRPGSAPLDRHAYIDAELAATAGSTRRQFFSIREYTLVEHRKGYTVARYLLIEGSTGGGETRAVESWQRETYEVQDGQWRLTAVEIVPETRPL
jgi:hypothetical protein